MKVFPIYPWHEAAGKEIGSLYWAAQQDDDFPQDAEVVAIIAANDPHAKTLRLLEEAEEVLCDVSRYPVASAYPDGPCLERETHDNVCKLLIEIRAHLAAQKGTQ